MANDLNVTCRRCDCRGHTTSRCTTPKHPVEAYHKIKEMEASVEELVSFLLKQDDACQSDTSKISGEDVSKEMANWTPNWSLSNLDISIEDVTGLDLENLPQIEGEAFLRDDYIVHQKDDQLGPEKALPR